MMGRVALATAAARWQQDSRQQFVWREPLKVHLHITGQRPLALHPREIAVCQRMVAPSTDVSCWGCINGRSPEIDWNSTLLRMTLCVQIMQ
jgi:hypothetical protein